MQGIELIKANIVLILFLAALPLAAQEIPLPEEEAPTALLDTRIGDSEVDILIDGSWRIQSSLGGIWGTPSPVSPSVPGFSSGFMFDQIPDLTLSLWLRERYFFETTFTEEDLFNTWLLGYEGREGEFLRRVRLGNTATAIDSTPLMEIPDHPEDALGVSATMETEKSRHELLVRYQRTSRVTKEYAGSREIDEVLTNPAGFIRGRYFLLPDADLDLAQVYLENREGPYTDTDPLENHRYRLATDFEAAVSLEQGIVRLLEPPAGRVLVYYEKDGFPVGDGNIGTNGLAGLDVSAPYRPNLTVTDFDWGVTQAGIPMNSFQITLDAGFDALLLWDAGAWSPFEFQAVYPAEGAVPGSAARIELLPSGELEAADEIDGEFGSGILTLRPEGFPRAVTRYPLAATVPELYGPDREPRVPWILRHTRPAGATSISVPTEAVEGSVRITVNGRSESRFTRLPDGTLEFPFPLMPSDDVTVSYELPDRDSSGADLLAVSSNSFTPFPRAPELELRGDLGLRWNIDRESYSREYAESPGSILLGTGASYEGENWGFALNGGISVGTHDTRGFLRLAGMEEGYTEFSISSHSLLSAAPSSSFAHSNRAPLAFTDYYQYLDTGGSSLQEYDWSPPAEQVYAVADGNPVGPAVASASDDDIEGGVAVLDYSFSAADEWSGAQIAAPGGEPLDLSSATGISFRYKAAVASGTAPNLILRVGATAEDLDDDGIIDTESGPYDAGFPFNQGSNTYYLGGGGNGPRGDFGNGSLESEDLDDDGLLDREGLNQVVQDNRGQVNAPSWKEEYIPLSAADRAALVETRSLQIILDAATAGNGRVLIGEIRIHGASFVAADGTTLVDEVEDTSLPNQFDLVKERFSSDSESRRALRLELTTTTAEAVGPVPAVPLEAYETLRFYYKLTSVSTPDLTLTLEGDGGSYAVNLTGLSSTSGWDMAEVDLSQGTVRIVGGAPASAFPSGKRDIVVRRIRINVAGGTIGDELLVDEIHLADPVPAADLGLLAEARWERDGPILSAGGLPLLGNFSWSGRSRVANPGFASGFSSADGRVYQVYQEADFSSLYSRAELSLNVKEGDDEAEVSGGHRLTIPETGPLQIEDGYSHDPAGGEYRFTKRNVLRLNLPKLRADASAEASYRTGDLSQNWNLSVGISATDKLSLSPEISLANTVFDPGVNQYAYAGGWLQGTRLLAYVEEEELTDRSTRGSLPVEYSSDSWWGVEFLPEAGVRRYGSDPRKELDEISLALNLPVTIFPTQFRRLDLDLRYRRAFSGEWRTANEATEGGFPGDITAWSSTAGRQPYLVGAAPFAEIFDTAAEEDFAAGTTGFDAGSYRPSTGFTIQRRFSSRLRDLLLPSFLSFETGRNYSRELDAVTSSFFTETMATMTAVNLFGEVGSYPLFSWYESDEVSTSASLSTTQDDEFSYGWQLENAVLLYGSDDERYSLKNSLSMNKEEERPSWSATASALWFGEPGVQLPPPLPAVLPDGTLPRLRHTEELTYAQKPLEGGSWQRNAGIKHATGVSYGESGFIEAYIALGLNTTPLSGVDENLSFYAFEAGIVGEFNF